MLFASTAAPTDSPHVPCQISAERRDELALISRLLEDDPRAWRQFNQLYSRLIHRCITRITVRFRSIVPAEDVNEIYANFCLQLLANDKGKLRSYQPDRGCSLASWLSLLAARCAYDFLRSRRREPACDTSSEDVVLSSDLPTPYEACELRERAALAASMIEHFSERDREFLRLYYGEGLEPEQIARRMGVSVKTVYSKKHKIQMRLEAILSQRGLAAA